MATEEINNELEGALLSDEELEGVAGGAVRHEANGQWSVINDATSQVVQTFNSPQAAIAFAKKNGYSTKMV